jgi:hypothetical protein
VRKLVALLSLAAVMMLAVTAVSSASLRLGGWNAKLTGQEVPKQAVKTSSAKGSFAGTPKGYALKYTLTFGNLTSPATRAFIGYGKKGKAGNISVVLCAPCKSPVITTANLNPSLKKAFAQHMLYVQLDTAKNPNGEIRGQL